LKKEFFSDQEISAYDALYEAQKIAFAPVIFQVARSLCELGILDEIESAGKKGVSAAEISNALDISVYGVETLLESALSCRIVNFHNVDGNRYKQRNYFLSKIGHCLLHDPMTRANMDFNDLVCYEGMGKLGESVTTGLPKGLGVFGQQWKSIYEALPSLPKNVKRTWDCFDHFYSNAAYPEVLATVLNGDVSCLVDIGANSGEFSILAAQHHPGINLIMVDLPTQVEIALRNAAEAGLGDRIKGHPMDVLDNDTEFPAGADIYWMSQFLSCFPPEEITNILIQIRHAMPGGSRVFILETCWDRQQHEASAFSLINTSPYFTCMANGSSKMYHSEELMDCIRAAGLEVLQIYDDIGICHTLFECTAA